MMVKVAVFFLVAMTLGVASALPIQETNGQRLARGLPPNPPKFMRSWDGRDLPTPAMVAKRTQTSPTPPNVYTGRLDVRNLDGSSVGHVRNWPGGGTIGGTNYLGPNGDLLVKATPSNNDLYDILASNPAFPAPFYVGAGGNSLHNNPILAKGSRNTIDFTNVAQTPPGSKPVATGSGGLYVESAIWSLNKNTKQVSPKWINPDGSSPPTTLAYDIRENYLFFVGDLAAYNEGNDTPASAVNLFII
ncbi:uncharacterized protein LACBIDRAFT_292021 [Laccaria bicolor S238N-H82]|uniref:Predicted protein n=1 Tax=Laccaria bicolor (strain S238N-H82 / ATCC MYA-4686) TaxID=486041 RepID=B0CTV7_LACBS|nr:uncharacterized protein LACBIDRAFT_292021 [Laccaria bicolor S238N-H82]EDR13981.1 predicted protein [Laccaria bicolor S238N-H82]|eukprot:XP_001874540.1 predicted protein [Laccaria bicolor S238N-H82]